MDRRPATVLDDPGHRVPAAPPAPDGLGWLRAHVARFCDGPDHVRRRGLVERVLAEAGDPPPRDSPTATLLAALGLPTDLADDVDRVAAAYQPHGPQTGTADRAADRLIAACGGRTEESAARVCVLVQAHAGTAALIDRLRAGSDAPPVPVTRRVDAEGVMIEVDLTGAPFGRGPHRCPGEDLARRLAEEFR